MGIKKMSPCFSLANKMTDKAVSTDRMVDFVGTFPDLFQFAVLFTMFDTAHAQSPQNGVGMWEISVVSSRDWYL